MLFCHFEGIIQVFNGPIRVQAIVIDQVRSMRVDQRIESQAILPAGRKVGHFHSRVVLGPALRPQQEGFLRRSLLPRELRRILSIKSEWGKSIWYKACLSTSHKRREYTYVLLLNLLNLEAQNNGPDETQNQCGISVNDIFCSNTLQTYSL